ncbi:MAG: tryptophan synthase subunit alpha [Desulfobacterium sp.]|nr:tryptophan synthase subunit alpha [Desulfobacterium sp.]MBU3950465.1 tryptophan synthase subunit alpha [Pseudomonadota bacterium]
MKTKRIDKTFEELKQKKEKALVGFLSAGDPDLNTSLKIIESMCAAGLDIIELGIPFSDPTADGPVIQRSSARALKKGITIKTVLEMTRKIRTYSDIPIILFSYYNPIHSYGAKAFYNDSVSSGADGVLVVDLPPEESDEMTSKWPGNELALIRLIAPTTPIERMKKIAQESSGFLYLVSKTGVTGSAGLDTQEVTVNSRLLGSITNLPICVGFGISEPEDVRKIAPDVDGIVVGSAFERIIEENLNNPNLDQILGEKVSKLKAATKL